jgi:dipeptidyl aminopeptidase/acylaminoacyl peptidase
VVASELADRASAQTRTSKGRLALMVVLLGAVVTALAVVGSRLATPPAPQAPLPGLLAVASMDAILVVDPSSGASHAITNQTLHDAYPVWSPDGTRLAVSQHDGRGQLQLIDADGGNRHPIVEGLTSGAPVAWSPDGARIAFAGYYYPGGDEPGLYVVNADGTGLTLLLPGVEMSHAARLAWSPDASMIAFAVSDPARPIDDARRYVYVVDVASGNVGPVSSSHVDSVGAPLAWRPGRMELLYAQQYKQFGELGHEDIVLAERVSDTWQERPVVANLRRSDVTTAMWLDRERLAYVRDNRLWVATLDGQPELPIGEPGLNPVAPGCVAPDGSGVAVPVSESGDVPRDALLLVPTDGSPATRVATGFVDPYGPACSWKALRP